MTIREFQGPYRFLSNFWIEPDDTCVEVEYQAAKCLKALDRNRFVGLTPGQAKRLGRQVALRADWESVKIHIMTVLVRQKFLDHVALACKLMDTRTAELIEGNTWGDRFWGVCRGVGENHLGKILMQVREELKGTV